MPFKVHYDKKLHCVICKFTGISSPREGEPYAKEVVRVGSEHKCKNVLVDVREGEIDFSTLDIYMLASMLDATGLDRSWRRAVVISKQFEELRFYENVATNRGYQVKIFDSLDEAINWLVPQD